MDTLVSAATLQDLVITRRIPASPAAVFDAWTRPERVRQWMAPYGMEIAEAAVDARSGGRFRTLMRDEAGKEYPNLMTVSAIDPPRGLALRIEEGVGDADSCGQKLLGASAEISFDAAPFGTLLTVRWHHPNAAMREQHREMGFFHGWGQTLDRLTAHVMTPAKLMPGLTPPTELHGWLHRMLGEWTYESTCAGPPGGAPMKSKGIERVRSLGGYWVVGESEGECPGGAGLARMIITMGYDIATRRFRGSWVGSMMGHMFVYDGALDVATNTLTLDSEGPSFTGEGTARYRDIVQLVSDDHRIMTGNVVQPDGSLFEMMRATFRRAQ